MTVASMSVCNPFLLENNALEFDLHFTKTQRKRYIYRPVTVIKIKKLLDENVRQEYIRQK